jgi:UDP-2-acetamido-2-deoxy-ribo-hexuluronate aminotransferase
MSDMKIQMVDLKNQYLKIKDEVDKAIQEVVDSGQFILGSVVSEFESKLRIILAASTLLGVHPALMLFKLL